MKAVEQKARMQEMFDAVAPRYQFLNRVLSAGIDRRWRDAAVDALDPRPGDLVVDLCAGTGDLGYAVLERVPARVVGVDLARGMLARGDAARNGARYDFVQGDAERTPLPDACAPRACVGFGIRNVASLDAALREARRILRPGGRFVILEFTTPPHPVMRGLYHGYFHHVLPRIGGLVSGNPGAYRYLPESVGSFPAPEALADRMRGAGFDTVEWRRLTGGIACLHTGVVRGRGRA